MLLTIPNIGERKHFDTPNKVQILISNVFGNLSLRHGGIIEESKEERDNRGSIVEHFKKERENFVHTRIYICSLIFI